MKKVGVGALCFSYTGCFLGAGFVSGRELWQFFGAFGVWGYAGFVLSALLFVFFGIVLIRLTQITGFTELDRLLVPWEKLRWLRSVSSAVAALFLFSVVMVMSAGVGALGHQLFGVPAWIGSAVFITLVALIAYFGVAGMLRAFSSLIPVLVAAALLFAVGAWSKFDTAAIVHITQTNTNPLMPTWLVASLTFVAYNLMGGIGIMVPIGPLVKKKSTAVLGIALAGIVLILVAGSILSSVVVCPGASDMEMPMVAVATALSPVYGYLYGVLLLLGMFCNALASLVALMTHLEQKVTRIKGQHVLFLAVMAVVTWGGSLFGFSDLIGVAFPIFGYVSVIFLVTMVIHYIQCCRKNRQAS